MTVFKGSVWIRRRNMLRCCLPETTTTTAKFDVYFVVTGSVTPASCCFSSSPTGLEDEAQSSAHSKLVLTTVTLFWSLSTSGTGLGPSLQVFCSRGVPRRRKIRGTHTLTRAHAHTQGTMPCCGCWPWPGGKFFATVPRPTKRKRMNSTSAFRKCPHCARRRSF